MTEEENLEFEKQRLELERQKLELEQKQLEFEKEKSVQGISSSSKSSLNAPNSSGLTSLLHQHKIILLVFAITLACVGGYYGIHHTASVSAPINSKGEILYKEADLENMLYGKPRDYVERKFGQKYVEHDDPTRDECGLVYHNRTYKIDANTPDKSVWIIFNRWRGGGNVVRIYFE